MDIKKLKEALSEVKDPRRTDRGNIRHRLEDIIIIGLCTVIGNGEDFEDMEDFGKERENWFRQFLELPNGIPDSDTFRRVFERIEPKALSESLNHWLSAHREDGSVIAIDGKTICGSKNHAHRAYHVVSAFVAENQITLGEITVDEKSNEITAVPELLETFDIKNSIVTADAMSCQKEIVQTIQKKEADYCIALKENQPTLYENIDLYFRDFAQELPKYVTKDKDHGRIEIREYRLLTDLLWLPEKEAWGGLQSVGMVKSTVTREGKTSEAIRYYLSSLTDLQRFAYAVRKHWAIENQLHWCLDVIFNEDSCRARKNNSPLNLNILRKIALFLCKQCTDPTLKKSSLKKKRFRAGLNTERLSSILFGYSSTEKS